LTDLHGVSAFERIVLAAIVGNSFSIGPTEAVSEGLIRNDATRSGLTDVAIVLALKKLTLKKFLERQVLANPLYSLRPPEFVGYTITNIGWAWVMANEDQFTLQHSREEK
jgi:hypothetical protein